MTGIEAERVSQILRHATDRLQILSHIPNTYDDVAVAEISSPAILGSLERMWTAEEQLKDIGELAGSTEGGKEISILKHAHRATRSACRNLLADRDSLQVLMGRPETQSEEFAKFIRYMIELKSHVYTRLTTTVEDEGANRTILHDLTERERHLEESKDALQAKLNEVREEKEHVIFDLDQTLRKLQYELQDITQHNAIELDSVQKEMSDAISKATTDHELRMRQLQDQVDGMERQTVEVMEKNREEEQRLRKEKNRSESALNSKIAQYDEDMSSRQRAYEDIAAAFAKESADYAVLKEYFDKVDADIGRTSEESRILAAVKRRADFGQRVLFMAAAYIQKMVRARQARAFVAKLMAKKKKKGKGGKKKK